MPQFPLFDFFKMEINKYFDEVVISKNIFISLVMIVNDVCHLCDRSHAYDRRQFFKS